MKKNVTAIMRVTTVALGIIIGFSSMIYASTSKAQKLNEVKVTISIKNEKMVDVLARIETSTGISFSYDKNLLGKLKVSSQSYNGESLPVILKNLLKNTGFDYEIINNNIVVGKAKPTPKPQSPGRITGKVLDEKGETLPGTTIRVVETGAAIQSNVDGTYQLSLAPGTYTLEVSYISFTTQRITGVVVNEEKNTLLDIAMKPDTKGLKEVVVTSTYKKASVEGLYARQKNNAGVTDGITAEQILRTPDNNAAQVLNRISGVNIQNGKFVVIRGLSDRYNNVLLNGSQLPSTEPNQRNFSFDVVPVALIDDITVYKTATPDLSGEFSGGIVSLNTKDIPTENLFRVKIGTGFNSRATGKDFYQPQRGKYDFLGFDDGSRQLPSDFETRQFSQWNSSGYYGGNLEDRKAYGEMSTRFPNRFNMQRYQGMPLQDYELNIGRVGQLKKGTLGGIFALAYRNEQTSNEYIDDGMGIMHYYKGDRYDFNTNLSGLLNIGYSFGNHKIAFKNTFSRKFTESAYLYEGKNLYTGNDKKGFANSPLFNTMLQNRLEGTHILSPKGFKLTWHAGLSNILRDEPDNKGINGEKQPSVTPYGYVYNNDNLQFISSYFSKLKEYRYTWSADAQTPFQLLGQQQLFKFGYQGSYRHADFDANIFTIRPDRDYELKLDGYGYDKVFEPGNFGTGKLIYYSYLARNGTTAASGYNAFQRLNSEYAMVDGHLTKDLRVIAGLRIEHNQMNSNTVATNFTANQAPVAADSVVTLKKTDILPSVNLIYSFTPKINVRAAYYKTVARPDLREISYFEYWQPQLNTYITGRDLKSTTIDNADIRFEYYPSPGEIFSISGFYKKFKNPIELQLDLSPSNPLTSAYMRYVNLQEATDLGIELNFRKSLNFISSTSFFKDLYVSGNFSYINARLKLQGEERRIEYGNGTLLIPAQQNRPLFGQAPYLVNLGLLYTGKHFGLNASYNRIGERIIYGSEESYYNEYEAARDVIDLQLSYRFLKSNRAEIKLNVADLLNQPVMRYFNNYKNYQAVITGEIPADANGMLRVPDDPSGIKYDERYDGLRRKFQYGQNFSMSLSYQF